MINLRLALVSAFLFFSTSSNATLLFSEYVEGSSYNKALELFNTGSAVDFSQDNYVVDIYVNGGTSPRYSITLEGMMSGQDTFVLAHTSADEPITSLASMLAGSLSFNGDDAITLSHNGIIVDRIGQVGVDPGSEWGAGLSSTQNNTLRRNPGILFGDTDALLFFDPVQQWQGFAIDDFSGLGNHGTNLTPGEQLDTGNVSVPAPGSSALIAAGLLPILLNGFLSGRRKSRCQASFT